MRVAPERPSSTQRRRGDDLEHRRGRRPGAQRQLGRAEARIGGRAPDHRQHAAVGDRDDDGGGVGDLEGAKQRPPLTSAARIQRQLGLAAVVEIGHVVAPRKAAVSNATMAERPRWA